MDIENLCEKEKRQGLKYRFSIVRMAQAAILKKYWM